MVDRLREVEVESRLFRVATVLVRAVSGDGHEDRFVAVFLLPQFRGDFIAIHPWQTDVEQDDIGLKSLATSIASTPR